MKTKTYSTEFSKSLGLGIGALVKGKKDYYILEHLVGSNFHTAGEKQEILLDEVILGRNPDCHVRFDESFGTVSRYHASIKRDGDNWRLTQLSQTNTTFLNGKPLQDSWYLQSGDEIQLAVNGPKLIFRVPTDKSGMSFSQRLDSFKDQVIRPFQTAFIVVCCVVALIIIGAITSAIVIKKHNDNLKATLEIIEKRNQEQRELIDSLVNQQMRTNEELAQAAIDADAAQQEAIRAKAEAFKARAEQIKANENLEDVQSQMQQLQEEMNSFYEGILKGTETEDYEMYDNSIETTPQGVEY